MGFRFSLKALLRVRGIYERRERQRLELIARRLVYAQRQLAALRKRRFEETGSLVRGLEAGMTGAELHFQTACSTAHERLCKVATQAVEDLRKQHKGQLAVYQRVRKRPRGYRAASRTAVIRLSKNPGAQGSATSKRPVPDSLPNCECRSGIARTTGKSFL